MLKVFAGADPEAAFAGRVEWHRAQQAELEGYLATLKEGGEGRREDEWRGPETTVLGGIEYHRQMIAIFERFGARTEAQARKLRRSGRPTAALPAPPTSVPNG